MTFFNKFMRNTAIGSTIGSITLPLMDACLRSAPSNNLSHTLTLALFGLVLGGLTGGSCTPPEPTPARLQQ